MSVSSRVSTHLCVSTITKRRQIPDARFTVRYGCMHYSHFIFRWLSVTVNEGIPPLFDTWGQQEGVVHVYHARWVHFPRNAKKLRFWAGSVAKMPLGEKQRKLVYHVTDKGCFSVVFVSGQLLHRSEAVVYLMSHWLIGELIALNMVHKIIL